MSNMTLRRKMALQIGAMVCAIGLLAGASIWGLLGLQRDLGSALSGYDELRQLYEVGSHIRTAQALLALEQPDRHQAMREIQHATNILSLSQHRIRTKMNSAPPSSKPSISSGRPSLTISPPPAPARFSINPCGKSPTSSPTSISASSTKKMPPRASVTPLSC